MHFTFSFFCFTLFAVSIATSAFPMFSGRTPKTFLNGILKTPCTRCPLASRDSLISALRVSGGAELHGNDVASQKSKFGIASTWAVLSVLSILSNAIKRLAPIAMQPFKSGDFTRFHWTMFIGFSILMAYVEGYKAFQKKFSPMVVERALALDKNWGILRLVFAGPYSMGLFHASKKRKIVSWTLTISVIGLVQAVKRLPYPWRSIIDAGVVAGLSWGSCAIVYYWVRSWFGAYPGVDAQLPNKVLAESKS